MNLWERFWNWYENKVIGSLVVVAVIQYIQIPHMLWNVDLYLEWGFISRVNIVTDFLLYGVDLLEIVSIINVTFIIYSIMRKKYGKRS